MNETRPDLRITDPQVRARLADAARYLAQLPDDQFTMARYSTNATGPVESLARGRRHCGCIIGHVPQIAPALMRTLVDQNDVATQDGPLTWLELGFAFIRYEQIERYTADVLFTWLFDSRWSHVDDTRQGAVERIRVALDDGVPHAFAKTPHLNPGRYACNNPGAPGTRRSTR